MRLQSISGQTVTEQLDGTIDSQAPTNDAASKFLQLRAQNNALDDNGRLERIEDRLRGMASDVLNVRRELVGKVASLERTVDALMNYLDKHAARLGIPTAKHSAPTPDDYVQL